MKVLQTILLLLFALNYRVSAQFKLSDNAEVSLYTCGSGEDLYALFGHTALRIYDEAYGIDRVYNYGTFSFSEDFYYKFTMGKLNYKLSAYGFQGFESEYRYYGRSIQKQVLNLTPEQKNDLYFLLEKNALPENAYYLYDFFYDNCSTRPREMLERVLGSGIAYPELKERKSFRDMIDEYLKYSPWADFGIDIGLGSVCDTPVTKLSALFLPASLYEAFENTQVAGKNLVSKSTDVYMPEKSLSADIKYSDPVVIFWSLFVLLLIISIYEWKKSIRIVWIDRIFFLLIGLVGWLVAFLWFFTDHQATKDNWNILWAFPLHAPLAFFVFSKKLSKWKKYYQWLALVMSLVLLFAWTIIPQSLHIAVLPILLAIVVRLSHSLIRKTNE